METRWLRKFPKVPGRERFNAYYVMVELLAEEERTVEYVHQERRDIPAEGGGFHSEYGEPKKRTRQEKWFRIREAGRKARWVPAKDVFDRDPHGGDPCARKT